MRGHTDPSNRPALPYTHRTPLAVGIDERPALTQKLDADLRLRVWGAPADGYHDVDELVAMGRRAKRAGLGLLVDLHFSDSWADPAHQTKPAAWQGLTPDGLRQAVYDHTYATFHKLRKRGVTPDLIQIGNELNAGMLWPDGSSEPGQPRELPHRRLRGHEGLLAGNARDAAPRERR